MYFIYILTSLVVIVNGWSTLDKTDKSYTTHKLNKSPDYKYYKVAGKSFKECQDKNDLCKVVSTSKEYMRMCDKEEIAAVCKRTCGKCPAVSPLSCHASVKGCCWDNITKVSSGCPECVDKTKTCRKAHKMCGLSYIQRACPETCKICSVSQLCFDDDHQKEFCPQWKAEGFCETEKELMTEYCAHTCELCDLKNPIKHTAATSNQVIEVFRKGSETLLDLPSDEKIASEKQLIKLLLEEKKKREVTNEKKSVLTDNEIVAKVINDNKKKESNMVDKAASNDKKSIDDSFKALVKALKDQKKTSVESSGKILSDDSFKALVKLMTANEKKKSIVSKKEAKKQYSEEEIKRANKALMDLIYKKEIEKTKKEVSPMLTKKEAENKKKSLHLEILNLINNKDGSEVAGTKKEANDENKTPMLTKKTAEDEARKSIDSEILKLLISKDGSEVAGTKKEANDKNKTPMLTKKMAEDEAKRSIDSEILKFLISKDGSEVAGTKKETKNTTPMLTKKSIDNEILSFINNKDESKATGAKKETNALNDISTRYLLELATQEELKKKRETEKKSSNDEVHDALFELLKEREEAKMKA